MTLKAVAPLKVESGPQPSIELLNLLQGYRGWSPIVTAAADGDRSVLRVIDWTGGQGTKPTVLGYLSSGGLVETAAAATDIRGMQGIQGVPGIPGDQYGVHIFGGVADGGYPIARSASFAGSLSRLYVETEGQVLLSVEHNDTVFGPWAVEGTSTIPVDITIAIGDRLTLLVQDATADSLWAQLDGVQP